MIDNLVTEPPRDEQARSLTRQEFCALERMSLSTYHKLKRAGLGPDEIHFPGMAFVRILPDRESLNGSRPTAGYDQARTFHKGFRDFTMMTTQMALAKYFNVSSSTVAEWISRGPFKKDKKTGKYDHDEFVVTLVKWQSAKLAGRAGPAGGLDLSGERAKLAKRQTEALEFKTAIAQGEYIRIKEVGDLVEAAFSVSRERILSQINVIATALQSRERPLEFCEGVLRDRIFEAMNDLASGEPFMAHIAELQNGKSSESPADPDNDRGD